MGIAIYFLLWDEGIKLPLLCVQMREIICIFGSILGSSKQLCYTGKVALVNADVA